MIKTGGKTRRGLIVFGSTFGSIAQLARGLWQSDSDKRWLTPLAVFLCVTGLLLIAAYWLGIVDKSSLVEVQTSLACPLMLAVMLLRFNFYSGHHEAHAA